MSYQKMLAGMVQECGKSLREIADACKEYNVKIDPSYISKLQSGKQQPPSEEVTVALAKVCGGDPEALLYEGYMEKAPEVFKMINNKLVGLMREAGKSIIEQQFSKEAAELFLEKIDSTPNYELVKQGIDQLDFMIEASSIFTVNDPNESNMKVLVSELTGLEVPDNSMFPLLPVGAKVQISSPGELSNGDVAVVKMGDGSYKIRRYYKLSDKIILIAEDPLIKEPEYDPEEITIIGKVRSVTKEL